MALEKINLNNTATNNNDVYSMLREPIKKLEADISKPPIKEEAWGN